MANKGLERSIVDRILTDLQGIDGSTNYYNNIPDGNLFDEFKAVGQCPNYPHICIGRVSYSLAVIKRRDDYEIPMDIEIWGRVKDINTPLDTTMKLLSDIRMAIVGDADLNSQVTELTFSAVAGAIEGGLGEVFVTISCNAHHITT